VNIRCDLISAGKRWDAADTKAFPIILGELAEIGIPDGVFSVDDRVLTITGVDHDSAIQIAQRLVDYTTTGAFRDKRTDWLMPPDPLGELMKPLVPIERSDG
jgi:hypothetical protein